MIRIGPHFLDNPVALAPMAGVTDLPFRRLCKQLGAGLVVSEMMSSDTSLWASKKSIVRRIHADEVEPRSLQIAGNDPAMMAEAARSNVALGAQIIDINMGCPAKKVCRKAAGSALLRDEGLVASILSAVLSAVEVPVTLKIRTGWSPEQRNGLSIARIAEEMGIAALAVHGRTRSCKFEGQAEFQTIRDICAAVSIPVYANGDINSPQKAARVLADTGAAGVMIGRAAQGRPWLCGQIAHYLATGETLNDPSKERQQEILQQYLRQLHAFYGEYTGVRVARKHVGWYLQERQHSLSFRREFNRIESGTQQLNAINQYFQTTQYEELAA
ncbi:MAG: tRNA dihydrouridine synthase DusB [Gammaproteobacteria bacterium]|nr:tRNA dihydrouridine synthase DusB [Gammaproteobacteria bacterium]